MDQNVLVSSGHALVRALDAAGIPPKVAMWAHNTETDTWKLWLVPPANITDKREFYRKVAEVISRNRTEMGGIDVSDTEMLPDTHPAVVGLKAFITMPGLGTVNFSGNRLNDYYLPDGVILRVAA